MELASDFGMSTRSASNLHRSALVILAQYLSWICLMLAVLAVEAAAGMGSADDREEEQIQRNGGDGYGRRSPELDLNLAIPKEDDADQGNCSSPLRERQCVQESEQEEHQPPHQQVVQGSERSPSPRRSESPVAKSPPPSPPRRSQSPESPGRKSLSPVSPQRKQTEFLDEQEPPSPRERSPGKRVSVSPHRERSISPRRRYSSPEVGRRARERDLSGSPRDSGRRRRERFSSRSPIERSARSGRSRSRSPGRDYHRSPRLRYSPRARYSPRRRSSPSYHSRQRSSRSGRPWSPPANRNTGVGKPGKNLFVAGFSFVTTERDLEKKFSRYGHVTDVRIIRDRRSGDSRGFGFLSLEHDEDADAAIRGLDQTEWNGRIVLVEKAKTLSRY